MAAIAVVRTFLNFF
nr:hypothetical protein [Phyllobacterium bourgognense]